LITAKCTKRYEGWLKTYSSVLLEKCNSNDSDEHFCREQSDRLAARKLEMRQLLEDNFKFATDCEDKQFAALLQRVDQGTTLKEVSCPFKNMKM
jgi:hypothetical protein